jgi:hypothetical protein
VALDADTGALKWHYQFTPHDDMDYDATQVPILADIEFRGRMRKVMLWANRNGLMYVLDRTTGEFLQGKPFVKVNWMDGFDEKGRPRRIPGRIAGAAGDGVPIMPTILGATNWYPASFSPKSGLFTFPAGRTPAAEGPARTGWQQYADGGHRARAEREDRRGRVRLRPRVRPEDARAEVGIQDGRHHLGRRALDRRGCRLRRWP